MKALVGGDDARATCDPDDPGEIARAIQSVLGVRQRPQRASAVGHADDGQRRTREETGGGGAHRPGGCRRARHPEEAPASPETEAPPPTSSPDPARRVVLPRQRPDEGGRGRPRPDLHALHPAVGLRHPRQPRRHLADVAAVHVLLPGRWHSFVTTTRSEPSRASASGALYSTQFWFVAVWGSVVVVIGILLAPITISNRSSACRSRRTCR